ncbi:MAG: magnesium and cobalt transport protein CorA [Acidimicrobiales bacterium]
MLIDAARYRRGVRGSTGDLASLGAGTDDDHTFVWAGLHDPRPTEIDTIAEVFDLHPLAVEDAIKAKQRPKAERYGDVMFVVLRSARYIDDEERVDFGEIQIFCKPNAVVVIRRGEPVPLGGVRARLEADPETLAEGPVAVLHAVIDEVVDRYHDCLVGLDDDVNEIELDVFSDHQTGDRSQLIERMYFLQREVLQLHRAIHPLVTALEHIRADPLLAGGERWAPYYRDVHDHLLRQDDQLQSIREVIGAALAAHSSQMSLRQNEDMRRISAWVAIAAVPTMIAGIYGMNFEHMPELDSRAGYPLVVAAMLVICVGLYRRFRRVGWL